MSNGLFKVTIIQYWLMDTVGPDGKPCERDAPGARLVLKQAIGPRSPYCFLRGSRSASFPGPPEEVTWGRSDGVWQRPSLSAARAALVAIVDRSIQTPISWLLTQQCRTSVRRKKIGMW